MCSTDIVCPICEETHLKNIKIPGKKREEKGQGQSSNFRSFYICFACKMTFFEEDLLKKQS